jgi:hypothetical protein
MNLPAVVCAARAQVRPVTSGTSTLKDATSEAIRDWVTNVETTHYILGSVAGPHPYPMMVRRQMLERGGELQGEREAGMLGKRGSCFTWGSEVQQVQGVRTTVGGFGKAAHSGDRRPCKARQGKCRCAVHICSRRGGSLLRIQPAGRFSSAVATCTTSPASIRDPTLHLGI